MAYKAELAPDAERDLETIFEFLVESYAGFGEASASAVERAAERIGQIRENAFDLKKAPFRGTVHDDMMPGLRHITMGRAIYWFKIEKSTESVQILAVFFGGQDHIRLMLRRLLAD